MKGRINNKLGEIRIVSEAERKSRKLPGVKWSARLAGAIHVVEIGGNLTF